MESTVNRLLLAALFAASLHAQTITPIVATDQVVATSLPAINANFTNLKNAHIALAASISTAGLSGAYADLTGKPTIPTVTSQISESGSLYFTNARAQAAMAGLYQAPITGAPGTWPTFATVATTGLYSSLLSIPSTFAPINPTLSTTGGVRAIDCNGIGHILAISTAGVPQCSTDATTGGSMVYPGAGVPNSTGSAWATSYTVGTGANNLVQLTAASKLPAVDGSLLTNLPAGMVYPGAGVPNSTGSAWGSSYTVGTGNNNLVQLNGSGKLPAVDGSLLTGLTGVGASFIVQDASGTPVAGSPATTIKFPAGVGVTCTQSVTAGVDSVQCDRDASTASKAGLQNANNPQIVTSTGGGTTYTGCPAGATVSAYATTQAFFWTPDTISASTAPTLNVCTLGAVTLTDKAGAALASTTAIAAGTSHWIVNDGSHPSAPICCFRIADLPSGGSSAVPFRPFVLPFGDIISGQPAITLTATANQVMYVPITVPAPGWTPGLVSMLFTGGPGNISMAWYYGDGNSAGTACTKVANGQGSTVTAASGVMDIAFTSMTLQPGLYFLGIASDNTSPTVYPASAGIFMSTIVNNSGPVLEFTGATASAGGSPNTLPSSCGSRTALGYTGTYNIPIMVIH